jgi:ferredoxin
VLPFAVNEITQLGLDALAAAFAYGAAQVVVLVPPRRRHEAAGLGVQAALAEAVLAGLGYGGGRVRLVSEDDPDAVEALLYGLPGDLDPAEPAPFLPMGGKRTLMRMALDHLHAVAPAPRDVVPLPVGAPFGRVAVDTDGCTLCLACVGACPTGALQDNPDLPQLRFQEDACVQCGLCANTCPERVIALEPRLNFADDARRALLVKEEEPFACIRCGRPFGTRSTVERIVAKLAEKHWMFQDQAAVDRIRMCDDCRVIHQFESGRDPFAAAERPRPRTTEDYLREREIEEARARVRAEREGAGGGS